MFDLGQAKSFLLKFAYYIMNILSELSNTVPCRCWRSQYSHGLRYPLNAHICHYTAEIHSNIRALPFRLSHFICVNFKKWLFGTMFINVNCIMSKMLDRICSVHMLHSTSATNWCRTIFTTEEIYNHEEPAAHCLKPIITPLTHVLRYLIPYKNTNL